MNKVNNWRIFLKQINQIRPNISPYALLGNPKNFTFFNIIKDNLYLMLSIQQPLAILSTCIWQNWHA